MAELVAQDWLHVEDAHVCRVGITGVREEALQEQPEVHLLDGRVDETGRGPRRPLVERQPVGAGGQRARDAEAKAAPLAVERQQVEDGEVAEAIRAAWRRSHVRRTEPEDVLRRSQL